MLIIFYSLKLFLYLLSIVNNNNNDNNTTADWIHI